MPKHAYQEEEFSPKNYFVPFTTLKAIHWIIIIGLLVFFNGLFNSFVGDDIGQLVDNAVVHSLQNIPQFFLGGTFNNGNGAIVGLYYKPLLLTTYSLIYILFGANSFFYHFLQLIFHISNAILVFILFTRFFKKELAFILSLFFLVHPINADTVDYIANLQDTMFLFFGLLSTYFVIFAKKKPLTLALVSVSFFLSLLSKETGVAFAFVIVGYCFLFEKQKLKWYIFLISLLVILYGILHLAIIGNGFSGNQPFPIMRTNLPIRLLTIPMICMYYLTTFFFPVHLTLDHQWVVKDLSFTQFYVPLGIDLFFLAAMLGVFFIIRNHFQNKKLFIFFSIWLLIGLTLHSQIIPLDYTVANRWFYFPIIGLLGLFGVVFTSLKINKKYTVSLLACSIVVILLLSLRTVIRNSNWQNGITLASHDIRYSPKDYSLESYLGVQYYNQGNYTEAEKHFLRSTQLAPYWDLNWNYLGEVYERVGETQGKKQLVTKAKQMYRIAIKNSVFNETPYDTMAHLLVFSADPSAESFITDSLKKYPHDSELWYYLAVYHLSKHDKQSALAAVRNAYLSNPTNQEAITLYSALLNGSNVNIQLK